MIIQTVGCKHFKSVHASPRCLISDIISDTMPFTKGHTLRTYDLTDADREKALETRRGNKWMREVIDRNDEEILRELDKDQSLEDYRAIATRGHNQIQRIHGLDLSSPKVARKAYNQIVERVKGRPAQQLRVADANGNDFAIIVQKREDAEYIEGALEGFDNAE